MIISLSILNVDEDKIKDKIGSFALLKQNWIHFDVMDGKFVNNETFSYDMVKKINEYCSLFKDVHLMTFDPDRDLDNYKKAGANQITFHYESIEKDNVIKIINKIKEKGMKAGISIKPKTSVRVLKKYLPFLDLILIMSVEPGQGGQKYINSCTRKIRWLKKRKSKHNYLISVDGGINDVTSKIVKRAGADVMIMGSYLVKQEITEELLLELMEDK